MRRISATAAFAGPAGDLPESSASEVGDRPRGAGRRIRPGSPSPRLGSRSEVALDPGRDLDRAAVALEAVEVEPEPLGPLPEVRVVDAAAVGEQRVPELPERVLGLGRDAASAAACSAGERGRLLASGKWRTQSRSGELAIRPRRRRSAGSRGRGRRWPPAPRRGRGRRALPAGPGAGGWLRRGAEVCPRTGSAASSASKIRLAPGISSGVGGGVRPGDRAVPVDEDQRAVRVPALGDRRP